MTLVINLAINVFSLYIVSYLVPGFHFINFWTVVVSAVVIGIINTFIKPILQLIFLPLSIVTLGLGAFLINVVLLWLVSLIVPGFTIDRFLTAVIASLLLSFVQMFLHKIQDEESHNVHKH